MLEDATLIALAASAASRNEALSALTPSAAVLTALSTLPNDSVRYNTRRCNEPHDAARVFRADAKKSQHAKRNGEGGDESPHVPTTKHDANARASGADAEKGAAH
jgi:hypothetical protein